MPSEPVRPTEVRLQEIVFPDHANHLGTLFGGQALAWMDKAAFIAASRYARRTVVTARSEQVDFRLPIRQGQLVEVELIAEDLLGGERELCTRGRFTMIALDGRGRPTGIPALPEHPP